MKNSSLCCNLSM